jgi:glycosyltransferase involved in cell wall biosynthesis
LYWAHQIGRVVGHLAKVPVIVSSQQSIDVWQKPWHRWIDRRTLPYCDVMDVNSTAAQQVIETRLQGSLRQPRFVKVENGVDFDQFKPINHAQARAFYKLPPGQPVGGTLMRLHAEKGAEKIPAFARRLLHAHPKLILLIGGTGPLESRLKKEAADLGDRIRWVGWQKDAVRFLSAIDFFWLLSREESFPQALLEASAVGLPWLAPNVGGIHELVEAGAAGLLAPTSDVEKIAETGEKLLSQLPEFNRIAQDAIPLLRERYSLEKMTEAFYRIAEKNDL